MSLHNMPAGAHGAMPYREPEPLPNGVQAAMHFLQHVERATAPRQGPFDEGMEGRKLTPMEEQVKSAALMLLLEYFRCGDNGVSVSPPVIPPDDEPPTALQSVSRP